MNIKYISLFSLLLISNASAMTPGKKLEIARNDLRDSQESYRSSTGCNAEKKAYEDAKKDFLAPHYEIMNNGIEASRKYYHDSTTNIPLMGTFCEKQAYKKHQQTILEGFYSGKVVEAFEGKSSFHFLDNKHNSTEEFCDRVLISNSFGTSSDIEDTMGKALILSAKRSDINAAKTTIKELIKEQSQ